MKTIRAIFENGVFRPLEAVDLPEATEVVLQQSKYRVNTASKKQDEIYTILSRRFHGGDALVAERHNEHQP